MLWGKRSESEFELWIDFKFWRNVPSEFVKFDDSTTLSGPPATEKINPMGIYWEDSFHSLKTGLSLIIKNVVITQLGINASMKMKFGNIVKNSRIPFKLKSGSSMDGSSISEIDEFVVLKFDWSSIGMKSSCPWSVNEVILSEQMTEQFAWTSEWLKGRTML